MKKKKIVSIFIIIAIFFVIIAGRYNTYSINETVTGNNMQGIDKKEEKFETVKGSKLKIGDYVNYDHTIQVAPVTKETKNVPKEKLTYTSVKGDLDTSGNGYGDQTVDISEYKTRWRVYDIQGDQVLLMPETQPTAKIKTKSALGYLWYEKEAYNITGLYGHGYGADETKEFKYEVGSRIPSEGDTRTETKTGTGARPVILSDLEEAYGITTEEQKQKLRDSKYNRWEPVGSNNLVNAVYYPTLNKENARDVEEKIDNYNTGDVGVSKSPKKLTDIVNEGQQFYVINLKNMHTKTYDPETEKDIQREILYQKDFSYDLISRSFEVGKESVELHKGFFDNELYLNSSFGRGYNKYFNSAFEDGSYFTPKPIVFLSATNKYYKEQGEGEYNTYSLIKEEKEKTQNIKIQNPYNIDLKNVNLKETYLDRVIFENNLESGAKNIKYSDYIRVNEKNVIENINYTVEGLPEGIIYDVIEKEVEDGKKEVTIQIYPKEISVLVNVSKTDMYDGAKFCYNISLIKNGTKINTKHFYEGSDKILEIAKYTNKEDMIDKNGNKIEYTLEYDNFNDTLRKDNTYYNNNFAKSSESNNNKIIYNLGIVYNKAKYEEAGKENTGETDKEEGDKTTPKDNEEKDNTGGNNSEKEKNNNKEAENEKHNDKKQDLEEEAKKRTELTDESSRNNKEFKKENNTKKSTSSIKMPYAGRKVSLPIIGVLVGAVYSVVTKKKILNNRNIAI